MKIFVILSVIATACFSFNTHASDTSEADLAPLTDLAKQKYLEMKVPDGNRSYLQLEAFSEKKIAKLTTKYGIRNSLYTFVVQGVIDEDEKKGTFADLDGLKSGSKATFNYSYLFFDEDAFKQVAKKSTAACDVLGKKKQEVLKEILACRAKTKLKQINSQVKHNVRPFTQKNVKNLLKRMKHYLNNALTLIVIRKLAKHSLTMIL